MPSTSQKQANYMRMVLAVKHGHRIEGMSEETGENLRETAKSMTDKQLRDFSHVATKPKAKR
jgi:phosphoribosylaminoimidazole (AIR) synthetase